MICSLRLKARVYDTFPFMGRSLVTKMIRYLNHIEEYTLFLMVLQMGISIFIQVVMRYLFQSAITWLDEVVHIEVILLTFFGASLCVKYGTHISVDILKKTIRHERSCRLIEGANHIIMIIYISILLFLGANLISAMTVHTHYTPTLRIPKHTLYLTVWIALALIGIRSFIGFYHSIWPSQKGGKKESIT